MKTIRQVLKSILPLALAATLGAPALGQTCSNPVPPQGAWLTITPSGPAAIGGPLELTLSGAPPGRPYFVAMDTVPGPVPLPGVGCLALGLSPAFQFVINGYVFPLAVVPPSGTVTLGFYIPYDPALLGRSFHFQAGAATPSAPFVALTNGSSLAFRSTPLRTYISDGSGGSLDGVYAVNLGSPGCPAGQAIWIPIGGNCWNLAADQAAGRLYVAKRGYAPGGTDGGIALVDMNQNALVTASWLSVPNPVSLAMDPTGSALFVLSVTGTGPWRWEVRRVSTSTAQVTHTRTWPDTAPGWDGEMEILADPGGQRVFVARFGQINAIEVLGAADLSPVATLAAPGNDGFVALAFRPGTSELWACGDSGVWIIDTAPATPRFVSWNGTPANAPAYPIGVIRDVVFDPATGMAWCTAGIESGRSNLIRIRPGSPAVDGTFQNVLYVGAQELGIAPGGNFLVATGGWGNCDGMMPLLIELGATPRRVCGLGPAGAGIFETCGGLGNVVFR